MRMHTHAYTYMYTVVRGTWYVVRGRSTDHVVRVRGMHIIHHTWYVVCHVTDVTYAYAYIIFVEFCSYFYG